MKLPLQITFRDIEHSDAMESDIRRKAAKLDEFCDVIMGCRVAVEARSRHRRKGNIYHVRIDLTVPDSEIVVNRNHDLHHSHVDAYIAIRDAFDNAQRQLQEYNRRRQQHVKTHEIPLHGHIMLLLQKEGYGKIQTSDGREVYFHRNSVLNIPFEELTTGVEVRFNEEQGEHGPQASTVKVIGKHHVH